MDEKKRLRKVVVYSEPEVYLGKQVERLAESLEILTSLERQKNIAVIDLTEAVEGASKIIEEFGEGLSRLSEAIEKRSNKAGERSNKAGRRRRETPPQSGQKTLNDIWSL